MSNTDDNLEQRLRDTYRALENATHPPAGLLERLEQAAVDASGPINKSSEPRTRMGAVRPFARPRQRSFTARWAPVGAVVAVIAILAAGAGVMVGQRSDTTPPVPSSRSSEPVPWSASGGRPTTAAAPVREVVTADPGTRRCQSDDFALISGSSRAQGTDGWMMTTFTLVSVAASPCADQQLNAGLADAAGTPLPVDAAPSGGMPRFDGPPRVDPADIVTGSATWAVVQGATRPPAYLVILPDDLTTTQTRPKLAVSLAGLTIPPHPRNPVVGGGTPWRSTSYGNDILVSKPGSLASLLPLATANESVRLGQPLRYSVELRNPTDDPVSLEPCPEVIEVLSVVPQKVAVSTGYRVPLNCNAAPRTIPPRGGVTFRMELATGGLVTGAGSVTWQLVANGRAVLTAQASIAVVP